ncbi:SDR family NAD(P)-dependent oxidoreductase [Paenibacillus sp. SN-8-1]|uniref:SDR family NAD(P)-dependent oxidoreductase n=1 Tax=Paenibacillus sp. SN-8-1 TaxID=3435409 RepID=UPI003D9A4DDE
MMVNVSGKWALITGASRGVGYQTALFMAKQGCNLITTSGIKNEPEQAGYAASKAALDKFTKDLASRLDETDIVISLTDPGWCRTDLGGPQAPNSVDTVIPGIAVGAFVDDKKSGRFLHAQNFTGMTLEEAVAKAEMMEATPYVI